MTRIFAADCYVNDFQELPKAKHLYGAWVAGSEFIKHIIAHGAFDQYHFFVLPDDRSDSKSRIDRKTEKETSVRQKSDIIHLHPRSYLRTFLKESSEDDLIFHTSNPSLYVIAKLRNLFAKAYFPIVGITHSINNAALIEDIFFKNLLSDLKPCDSIICTSLAVRKSLQSITRLIQRDLFREYSLSLSPQARFDHLPLGVSCADFPKISKRTARSELKLPESKIIILFLGRFSLSDKADLHPLFLCFKNLLKSHPNILLVLGGKNFQGNYGQQLQKLSRVMGLSSHIHFFFNPDHRQKQNLYAAADIFVSPSDGFQESFGLTVIEAMAAGLPVVVSDWDGYKDIVIHQETGFRVPTLWSKCDSDICKFSQLFGKDTFYENLLLGQSVSVDLKSLTFYLAILIRNKELRQCLGKNGRLRAVHIYDWPILIPKYEDLFRKLTRRAKDIPKSPQRRPLFFPSFYHCFKNYATSLLDPKCQVRLTEYGERLLETRNFSSVFFPPFDFIRWNVMMLILMTVHEHRRMEIKLFQKHILKQAAGISPDEMNYHTVWMIKKGLIEIVEDKRDPNAGFNGKGGFDEEI